MCTGGRVSRCIFEMEAFDRHIKISKHAYQKYVTHLLILRAVSAPKRSTASGEYVYTLPCRELCSQNSNTRADCTDPELRGYANSPMASFQVELPKVLGCMVQGKLG